MDMKPGNTRLCWLRRLFTFRLSSLFILITLIAVGTTLYLRAEKRARICTELHGLGCPVVRSGSLSATEMEKRFYEANLGAISPNEMAWSGFAPAVCGAWESKRFTVLVDFGAVTPIALFEGSRIRSLIAQLDGVDTVVIGAGHNPEILSHPKVAAFVDEIRRVRPSIRIVTQRYIVVG